MGNEVDDVLGISNYQQQSKSQKTQCKEVSERKYELAYNLTKFFGFFSGLILGVGIIFFLIGIVGESRYGKWSPKPFQLIGGIFAIVYAIFQMYFSQFVSIFIDIEHNTRMAVLLLNKMERQKDNKEKQQKDNEEKHQKDNEEKQQKDNEEKQQKQFKIEGKTDGNISNFLATKYNEYLKLHEIEITIKFDDASIDNVFSYIKNKTGITFGYSASHLIASAKTGLLKNIKKEVTETNLRKEKATEINLIKNFKEKTKITLNFENVKLKELLWYIYKNYDIYPGNIVKSNVGPMITLELNKKIKDT